MIEYEEIDGKLQLVKEPCQHDWSNWVTARRCKDGSVPEYGDIDLVMMETRYCLKCRDRQVLVPAENLKPKKLPVRSSFSVFLADWKARWNK